MSGDSPLDMSHWSVREDKGEALGELSARSRLDVTARAAVLAVSARDRDCELRGVEVERAGAEQRAAVQLEGDVTEGVLVEVVLAREDRRAGAHVEAAGRVDVEREQRLVARKGAVL